MQVKPTSWPVEGDIETLPEVFLSLSGSAWPPARGGVPQGTAEVASWSVTRQLTGGALPGQVRGATGHSIATGDVTFPQPEGAPLSPWARGALSLGPGGKCTLYATHAGPGLAKGLRLGSFVVAPIAGSNTSNEVKLDLDEDSIRLQKPFTFNWAYDPTNVTFDAAWVLEKVAASAGYTKTDIEPTGSILSGVFGVAGKSAWSVAQEIAEATMGAVWISEDGVFTYRNRDSLRGVGGYTETVEALDSLESLEWSIDPADVADRVEVTYTPTEIVRSPDLSVLWEATEAIRVGARQTVILNVEIEGTTDRISGFVPLWPPTDPTAIVHPENRMSRWAAATSSNGGGARPTDTAIRAGATMVGPSKLRITVTNTTGSALWLVDGSGSPCLIVRTSLHVISSEPVTISTGATEENAINPLSVETGAWVQDDLAAQEILAWVTAQTTKAQAVIPQVRVKPDLARQLGDVIRLTDGHTGLLTKAIVAGVSLAGDGTGYSQQLDLALLALVIADLDRWCETSRIDTFADFDSWCIANNMNTFSQLDDWLIDFGGTL